MRRVHVAAAAVAALLFASLASAQGLGDVAAREKEKKRKAEGTPAAKSYTENDLGPSMAPVGTVEATPAAEDTEATEAEAAGEGEATTGEAAEGEAVEGEAAEGETGAEGESAEGAAGEGEAAAAGAAEGAAATPEQEARARAEEAWRRQLDQARKEEQVYREVIDKLQFELNDVTGGVYTPARAAKIEFLEENQLKLAETQQKVANLEAEGRAAGYR